MAAKKPKVKCPGCGERFFREDEPHVHLKNRYWHSACYNQNLKQESKSEEGIRELETYICELFSTEYVTPRIRKQINTMITQYNFTHSGILGSLKYWFEVKDGSLEKANNGIGIVPYIYEDASKYYETLFYAHQANKGIENIDIDKITIKIRSPERKVKKMKTIDLSYLEEGEMS